MDVAGELDCVFVEENDFVSRYVAEKLSPEEAEAFEQHYFGCERCWGEVRQATEVRATLSKVGVGIRESASGAPVSRVVRGPWRRPAFLVAAAAAAAAAVVTLMSSVPPIGKIRQSKPLQQRLESIARSTRA